MAPQVGLEPTTLRLTAGCSAIELLRSVVTRSCCLRTSSSYQSSCHLRDTDAHYLRLTSFQTMQIFPSIPTCPPNEYDSTVFFRGFDPPLRACYKNPFAPMAALGPFTSSRKPPVANGNPTRPSSALLFHVLQWKRVRNPGHGNAVAEKRRPETFACPERGTRHLLIPRRSSSRRTPRCAPG